MIGTGTYTNFQNFCNLAFVLNMYRNGRINLSYILNDTCIMFPRRKYDKAFVIFKAGATNKSHFRKEWSLILKLSLDLDCFIRKTCSYNFRLKVYFILTCFRYKIFWITQSIQLSNPSVSIRQTALLNA